MSTLKNSHYRLHGANGIFKKLILGSIYLLFFSSTTILKGQNLLPETSYKYKVTRQVFDRLTYVFANSRPQPQLQVMARQSGKPKIIAQYQPGPPPLIQLSEEVYNLCRGLGKDSINALAVLLSHELAHHYEKHDWYYTFGIGQAQTQTTKEEIKRFESEADFYGCFYGELAGFSTGRVFSQMIDLLYSRFNLTDQLQGYPTKKERKSIYSKKQTEAGQMVAIFKAGQFLYLIQEFELAATCFEYLLNSFPSREILNNLSAAKLQQALAQYNAQEPPGFIYPVELDARSRLTTIHRDAPVPFKATQFRQLLSEARRYSEKSREIDPGYLPAYINLACIFSLGGNQAAAIGVINELDPTRLTGNAYTVRGIAYYKDKQPEKAQQDFELAQQKVAYMASYNLALFLKLKESLLGNVISWIQSWFAQEELAAASTKSKVSKPESRSTESVHLTSSNPVNQVKVSEKPYVLLQWKPEPEKLILSIQTTTCRYVVRYTLPNNGGKTSRTYNPGSTSSALVKQYGSPTYTYPGASGEYWIYPNQKLAFEINPNGQVRNWLTYAVSL